MHEKFVIEQDEKVIFLQEKLLYSGCFGSFACTFILTTHKIILINACAKKLAPKNISCIKLNDILKTEKELCIKEYHDDKTPLNVEIVKIQHKKGSDTFYFNRTGELSHFTQIISDTYTRLK